LLKRVCHCLEINLVELLDDAGNRILGLFQLGGNSWNFLVLKMATLWLDES